MVKLINVSVIGIGRCHKKILIMDAQMEGGRGRLVKYAKIR